jgi:hypothetical protein
VTRDFKNNLTFTDLMLFCLNMKQTISLLVTIALWLSSSFQPSILGQKRHVAAPIGYPILHAVTHVDLIEQYERKTVQQDVHYSTKQELDLHYDLTQDFRVVEGEAGAGSFAFGGINPAVPGGSAHVILDSSESGRDYHKTYKADTSGAVEQGGLTFVSNGPGREEIQELTVHFPDTCKSTGEQESDDCGLEDLDYVERGGGGEHSFYVEQRAVLHHKDDRPPDLSAENDLKSDDWYGGNVVGALKTGYKIDFTGIKKFDDTPREGEHYDSFYNHAEKKLTVSIVVTPTGKFAFRTDGPGLGTGPDTIFDVADRPRIFSYRYQT